MVSWERRYLPQRRRARHRAIAAVVRFLAHHVRPFSFGASLNPFSCLFLQLKSWGIASPSSSSTSASAPIPKHRVSSRPVSLTLSHLHHFVFPPLVVLIPHSMFLFPQQVTETMHFPCFWSPPPFTSISAIPVSLRSIPSILTFFLLACKLTHIFL